MNVKGLPWAVAAEISAMATSRVAILRDGGDYRDALLWVLKRFRWL